MNTHTLLEIRDGRLMLQVDGAEAIPVKLVKARPMTLPDGPIAALDEKKHEVASWPNLEALPEASREVARRALEARYVLPRITRITGIRHWAGSYWWDVETDRGPKHFVVKNVHRTVTTMEDGRILLKDVLGNRFEIVSLEQLDGSSRSHYQRLF